MFDNFYYLNKQYVANKLRASFKGINSRSMKKSGKKFNTKIKKNTQYKQVWYSLISINIVLKIKFKLRFSTFKKFK